MKTDYPHEYTVTVQITVALDQWSPDGQERAEAKVLSLMPSGDFERHTPEAYDVRAAEVVYVDSLKCEHGSSLHDLCQWVEAEVNGDHDEPHEGPISAGIRIRGEERRSHG